MRSQQIAKDYRERYKPHCVRIGLARVDFDVIEELSGRVVAKGPMSYEDALDIADRKNAELAACRL